MIVDKKIETLEHSAVKLTLTVDANTVNNQYKKLLSEYVKTAHIKGFRKGKVPVKVLEQKAGDAIKGEATMNIMEESLKEAYEEIDEKPLYFSTPALIEEAQEKMIELDNEFTFSVMYDVMPKVNVENYKGIQVEVPVCKVGKKEVDIELEKLRDQNSTIIEKSGGKVKNGEIVNIDICEIDDQGNEIEDEKREDFVFTIGRDQNFYEIDDDIIGMSAGEAKIVEKDYSEDCKYPKLAGKKMKYKIKLNSVKIKELPKLDDELAQDINDDFKTLEDLKNNIKKELQERADNIIEQQKREAILDKILETVEIDLPESMIKAELENSWHSFLSQSRMSEEHLDIILKAQGRSKVDLQNEWRPSAERSVKKDLVIMDLREKEKIEMTEEELDEAIQNEAEASGIDYDEAREYLFKNNLQPYLEKNILERKVFDFLVESAEIIKGEKKEYLDLVTKQD